MWGTLITLRTDARSNLREALFNANTYIHISLSFQLLKAHCSMARQPTLGCHSSLFFLFFFFGRLSLQIKPQCLGFVAKMIRSLLSGSHVIIPHSIQSQPTLEPAEACFIVLFTVTPTCVCLSSTPERFLLFVFFPTTLQVCGVQDGGAK